MNRRRANGFYILILSIMPFAAFGLGSYCSNTAAGVLMVLAEPFVFAILMAFACSALLVGRKGMFLSVIASGVLGAVGLQRTHPENTIPADGSEQLRTLKGCSVLSRPIQAPIRIFIWTETQPKVIQDALDDILNIRPDIIILNGSDDPVIGSIFGERLNGEVKFFPETKRTKSLTTIVRGSFQYCGGEDDVWHIPVESGMATTSHGIITFPHVDQIGVFPLVVPRLTKSSEDLSWIGWAQEILDVAQLIAETSFVLGTGKLVVAGNTQVPVHTTHVAQTFQKVGLTTALSEPNWPTSILGLPFLTLHTLDQAWVGQGWHIQSAKSIDLPNENRKPMVFDLAPNENDPA